MLDGPILVHGPVASAFEEAFCKLTGAAKAISVSSCTAGMHLAYFSLGLGKGDEVIVPSQTHVATAHAVELTGATPIFVDCDPSSGNIDLEKIQLAVTSKTKAIAVVHYLGVPIDMQSVMNLAREHGLFVLEDCALSVGAYFNKVHTGLHGDVGVFSFYPVKHLTTAEGGVVITKNEQLAKRLQKLKAFGVDRTHSERKLPGQYDVDELGFNYRMSELHAAIGVEQLKKLPNFLASRKLNFEILEAHLSNIKSVSVLMQPVNETRVSSHYCLAALLNEKQADKRKQIMEYMAACGVGCSIYYPTPVPLMTYYKSKYSVSSEAYGNAQLISDRMIALPVGPHLDEGDMEYVAEIFKRALLSV